MKQLPENQDQEKMLSIKETAELLGMGVSTLSKKLHSFSVKGIVNENKRVWIPLSSIPELKISLDYNDEFDKGTYYSTAEVAKKFNENGLKVKRTDVSNWIKNGKVTTIMHMGYRYIHENDLDQFIKNIINERVIPEGFCTIEEAANILEMHPQSIRDWASNGDIESMRVIVNDYWQTLVKKDSLQAVKKKKRINMLKNFVHVDIDSIPDSVENNNKPKDFEQKNIKSLEGFLEVKAAANLLGIKSDTLGAFLRKGKFPSAVKVKNKWYIPKGDVLSYKERLEARHKKTAKVTVKNQPFDGYLTTSEVSVQINLSTSRISKLIHNDVFPNAVKVNNKWFIPKNEIVAYQEKRMDNQRDLILLEGYLTISDVVNRIHLSHSRITKLIQEGFFQNAIKVNNKWFIPEEEILTYQEELMADQTKPDVVTKESQLIHGHLTVSEIVNRINLSRPRILNFIYDGLFPNAKKTNGKWYIPEEDLNYYYEYKKNKTPKKKKQATASKSKDFVPPQGYLTTKVVAKKLDISVESILGLINRGRFINAKKFGKYWLIPESDVIEYKRQKEKNQISVTKPDMIHELKQFINSVQDIEHLKETIRLYADFLTTKINATNGRLNNIRRVFNNLKKLYSDIIINLEVEITTLKQ